MRSTAEDLEMIRRIGALHRVQTGNAKPPRSNADCRALMATEPRLPGMPFVWAQIGGEARILAAYREGWLSPEVEPLPPEPPGLLVRLRRWLAAWF